MACNVQYLENQAGTFKCHKNVLKMQEFAHDGIFQNHVIEFIF